MWLVFGVIVLISLVVDLVAHRGGRGHTRRSATLWSIGWIALAFGFAAWIWWRLGAASAGNFVSAYLMEKSLSVDNMFVFMVVFSRLGIPQAEQHRVLFWGIIGALVARAVFIAAGSSLLTTWHDIVYVFGAFLIFTAYRTARAKSLTEPAESKLLEFMRRHLRITDELHGHKFLARIDGRLIATPLLVALLTIEATDVMFAIDSVPAVFAITEDPFIVYSSNVFAILGLRALYLVLSDLLRNLRYLHYGLAAILALAGIKMIAAQHFHVPHYASLSAIIAILAVAVIASLLASSSQSHGMGDAPDHRHGGQTR